MAMVKKYMRSFMARRLQLFTLCLLRRQVNDNIDNVWTFGTNGAINRCCDIYSDKPYLGDQN